MPSAEPSPLGLIAGNGQLPFLFARAARKAGHRVVAVAHRGETDETLAAEVDAFHWVRVGQVDRILRVFREKGVQKAAMAGGIGRVRALSEARPDFGALRIVARLKSFRDDGLLRAIAAEFESHGVEIIAPTSFVREVLAPAGLLAGPPLSAAQTKDVELAVTVARRLGEVDVGQAVVVRNGHVLALEAVEGTDATIRRGGALGGKGAVVVKLVKPGQDERFDLPAVGPRTLDVMHEVGARVLAVEAGRTVILEIEDFLRQAAAREITVWGLEPEPVR